MDAVLVRKMVDEFREHTGFVGAKEHCLAPWYLHQVYQIPEVKALGQSSDGNYDFGVDAFHLVDERLILIQSKFTDSLTLIEKGFKDLQKVLPEIVRSFEAIGTEENIQNKVLVNLRAALNRMGGEERSRLTLEFQVLHLSTVDEAILNHRLTDAMRRLSESVQNALPSRVCRIRAVGPQELGPHQIIVAPPEETSLRLAGAYAFDAGESCKMTTGIGNLADLVDIYRVRRDELFARNVRYFLNSKKNTEKGPAGKMRGTLRSMCIENKVDPERFAPFHNGISLYAKSAVVDGKNVRVRDPYVLNGCQTIKNAFLFRYDPALKDRINVDHWERVAVPIRIICTTDDDLVRTITVNNNRQNSMSPAALRANDALQIRLEQRFKEHLILYERQEGAFDAIWATNPDLFEDAYENTQGQSVNIHELARAIAASLGKITWALHPNDLFEADKAYSTTFSEKKTLQSIVFLTFLQNLHDIVGLILKMDLNLAPQEKGPRPSRLLYQTICLLTRHLAVQGDEEFVLRWGTKLWGRDKALREEIRKMLNSHQSGIRSQLAKHFMKLNSTKSDDLSFAFDECQKELDLGDKVDPFGAFMELDARAN